MRLQDLNARILEHEGRIAGMGEETPLLGLYNVAMSSATGHFGVEEPEADPEVPQDQAEWWLRCYQELEERGEMYQDLQDLFDAID
ncbi:hypothetical protein [Thiohalorhabdus methylotrophus]|uniref:Uncharacterized protein n=1 Tax=Thiohalorhabdus methylotrophus TaxID=3242694 RepID=A0ABV4TUK4_9GAMM